jgi:hypothetical protein
MPSLNTNFDWVDTPNPTERAFTITAKEGVSDMIPDFYNNVVLWADCPQWIKKAEAIPESLQGYTLVNAAKADYQKRTFTFGRTRTPEERMTPYHVEWELRPMGWPTVLYKLWFEEGNLPITAVDEDGKIITSKRLHQRAKVRRGAVYPTWHKISRFLAERPFPKTHSPAPIADSISYSFDGLSGSFPECLHPDCRFPQVQTSGKVVFGAGTQGVEIGGDLVAQEYPATNMTDWEKHVIEDSRYQVTGMYFRQLVQAYPPIDDRENLD